MTNLSCSLKDLNACQISDRSFSFWAKIEIPTASVKIRKPVFIIVSFPLKKVEVTTTIETTASAAIVGVKYGRIDSLSQREEYKEEIE